MGKRPRPTSIYSKHEVYACNQLGDKRENYLEDRISQLPDDVLVSILSLLTIREAARTSVLSHRWERLWTSTSSLNFDATLFDIESHPELLTSERSRYISWVNQVLDSLDGSTLDAFRVRFDLDKRSRDHIHRWIEFAIEKKVQNLELNLKPVVGRVTDVYMRYAFPLECYARIKQPCGLYRIKSLTSLSLKFVNVSGEIVEHFLSNCPLLERLCVVASGQLLNLKVAGSSLQLKYLDISQCYSLKCLEISAPNLVSLKYFGKRIKLLVKNVPQLVKLSVGGCYHDTITSVFCSLSSYLSQLKTLKLDIDIELHEGFTQFLELTKLEHLILRVEGYGIASLLGWISLINASPFLHRFTLKLIPLGPSIRRYIQKVTKCPHQCLQVVEMVGFVGCTTEVELVMYLLENASRLETIIIDRPSPFSVGKPWKFEETKAKMAAKKRAMQLKSFLPPGVELVII